MSLTDFEIFSHAVDEAHAALLSGVEGYRTFALRHLAAKNALEAEVRVKAEIASAGHDEHSELSLMCLELQGALEAARRDADRSMANLAALKLAHQSVLEERDELRKAVQHAIASEESHARRNKVLKQKYKMTNRKLRNDRDLLAEALRSTHAARQTDADSSRIEKEELKEFVDVLADDLAEATGRAEYAVDVEKKMEEMAEEKELEVETFRAELRSLAEENDALASHLIEFEGMVRAAHEETREARGEVTERERDLCDVREQLRQESESLANACVDLSRMEGKLKHAKEELARAQREEGEQRELSFPLVLQQVTQWGYELRPRSDAAADAKAHDVLTRSLAVLEADRGALLERLEGVEFERDWRSDEWRQMFSRCDSLEREKEQLQQCLLGTATTLRHSALSPPVDDTSSVFTTGSVLALEASDLGY